MNIAPHWRVLEIGSGNNPNPRSDVLCDRFISDNGQRAGKFSIVIDRPMVVADGYHLPFADNSFDYVICSHIVEHLIDPQAFLSEVARVGIAGYIEVPSAAAERLFGWDFHLWYCELKHTTLVLYPKKDGEKYGGFFHRLIATTVWFRRFFEKNENHFNLHYEWHKTPAIVVEKKPLDQVALKKIDLQNYQLLTQAVPQIRLDVLFWIHWMLHRIQKKIKKMLRLALWQLTRVFSPQQVIAALVPLLVCPQCKSRIRKETKTLYCPSCYGRYQIDGILPILLQPTEVKKGY